jgi:magnesium transporter
MGKRHYLRYGNKLGHAPGTLLYTGKWETPFSVILTQYSPEEVNTLSFDNPTEIQDQMSTEHNNWCIIESLNNAEHIELIGKKNGLSELQMEDIMSVRGLPKVEYGKLGTLISIRRPIFTNEEGFRSEHMTLYLRDNALFLFRETNDDFFQPLFKRLSIPGSRLRNRDCNYLLYAILDLVVDHYMHILDLLNEQIQDLEDVMLKNTSTEIIQQITESKRTINLCQRYVTPTHSLILDILKANNHLSKDDMQAFYQDLDDHLSQTKSQLEFMKDHAKDLVEFHATLLSTKTNQVMTMLTILSSIFIPLTFIAGVYGMNFEVMPELKWANGYYYVLTAMGGVGLIMFVWMKTRKWF